MTVATTPQRYAEPITKYPRGIAVAFHRDGQKNAPIIAKKLGDLIVSMDKFIHFRESDDLLHFNGWIYEEFGDQYIHEVCNQLLGEEYTTYIGNEVVGYIKTLSDNQVQHIDRKNPRINRQAW